MNRTHELGKPKQKPHSASKNPRHRKYKFSDFRALIVNLVKYILPIILTIVYGVIIYQKIKIDAAHAQAMYDFLSIVLSSGVFPDLIIGSVGWFKKRTYLIYLFVIGVIFLAISGALLYYASNRKISVNEVVATFSSAEAPSSPETQGVCIPFNWTNDIYLIGNYSINDSSAIIDLLLNDAQKYTNGTETRPARLSEDALNSGAYGTYIKLANDLQTDRKNCQTPYMIKSALEAEITTREDARKYALEADNARELGNLYILYVNYQDTEPSSKAQNIQNAISRLIEALELAYADSYELDFITGVWKSLSDAYNLLSTEALDKVHCRQAAAISEAIRSYLP